MQLDSICKLSLKAMYHRSKINEWIVIVFCPYACRLNPHLKRQQADLRSIAMSHTQRHM